MTYPHVQAAYDYGPRRDSPVRGFVVHMAEGGGTVGYLAGPNARGVSVHYVIERSGRTVRMLREDRVSGSINPREIRTSDGPAPYGRTAAVAVLGAWANDPNRAVLSLELEGFAREGPNASQAAALVALVADIRTRYPTIGLLGHRDFADYKACPGAHIPWERLGGHGPPAAEDDMPGVKATPIGQTVAGIYRCERTTGTYPADGSPRGELGAGGVRHAIGPYGLLELMGPDGKPLRTYAMTEDGKLAYVPADAGVFTPLDPRPDDPDTSHTVALTVDGSPVWTGDV